MIVIHYHNTVFPAYQRSPCLDNKSQYSLGKKKLKRFAVMNVYTAQDTPSPQAFSPSEVPDFTQEGYTASCFGPGYGYDGSFSQLEDTLLSPPSTYFMKLDTMVDSKGGLSLTDCGEVYSNELDLGSDWLQESMALPTPEEQEGDITFSDPALYGGITNVTLPVTPDCSYPPTPLSTSPNSDVEEVLSLFSDHNSSDPTGFAPEYLSLGQSFDSFDSATEYSSPVLTPVDSPFPSSSSYTQDSPLSSPLSLENSRMAIKDLLAKKSAQETSRERKRKLPQSTASAPKPKRRLSQAAKKERKREQNKCAALRYRQKKKEEKSGCFSMLDVLETKNAELKKTVSTMTAEIEYLKKLWSEVNAKRLCQQTLSVC